MCSLIRRDSYFVITTKTQEKRGLLISKQILNVILNNKNSADPAEMPHSTASHLSLHCLSKVPFIE